MYASCVDIEDGWKIGFFGENVQQALHMPCSSIALCTSTYTQARNCVCATDVIIFQALFLCSICVVFRPVVPFGKLHFIHASTNATDDHKYSPLPCADFDSSEVLVSNSELIFS